MNKEEKCIIEAHFSIKNYNLQFFFENNDLVIGNLLIDNFCLKTNQGIPAAKDLLVWKYCQINPSQILNLLSKRPENIFADTLIIQAYKFAFMYRLINTSIPRNSSRAPSPRSSGCTQGMSWGTRTACGRSCRSSGFCGGCCMWRRSRRGTVKGRRSIERDRERR